MLRRKPSLSQRDLTELLDEVQRRATDSATPIADLLRLCLRLGSALRSNDLSEWARQELNGYHGDEVPDYRVIDTPIFGDFNGPFGSGVRNAPLPIWLFDDDQRSYFLQKVVAEPIAEVEQLALQSREVGENPRAMFPAHTVAMLQRKPVYDGLVLAAGWQTVSATELLGLIDVVRTKALELSIELGERLPPRTDDGEQPLPEPEVVAQVFHTVINDPSNVAVGQIGSVAQSVTGVSAGDLSSLIAALKGVGIPDSDLDELKKALEADIDAGEQPGPNVTNWIGRTMTRIGTGALAVSNSAAGSFIANAVMAFLGLGSP